MSIVKNTIRHGITRQLRLFAFAFVLMFFFLVVGFLLSTLMHNTVYLEYLPAKNTLFLIVWRALFYSAMIACLTPYFFSWLYPGYRRLPDSHASILLRYRRVMLCSIIVYEGVIVQNSVSIVLQWGLHYVR